MAEANKALIERLFAAHRDTLLAFFYRRVRNRSEATDLAQEVYLRMLRVRDTNTIRNTEAYLFTVASNLAKEHGALEQRRGVAVDVEDSAVQEQLAALPGFDRELDAAVLTKRLREVLRQLPPKWHAALVFQYAYDLTYQQIAERMNISPRRVKKYLGQALGHCRRRMAGLG